MDQQEQYKTVITWLMEGEPSIRFQTMRDLLHAPEKEISLEQERILKEGWGRKLLDLQDKNGTWANALYSPKWTSTFYTLLLLKGLGAPSCEAAEKACRILLDKGFYEKDGGINYWKTWKLGECCVTGMLLGMLCYFSYGDDRLHLMLEYLLSGQMADKGWNCEQFRGARHSSFHTTISVLEGLREYEKAFPESALLPAVQEKQRQGVEFLLQHRLYKSSTTGDTVHPDMVKLAFPPRWHYDIGRSLDYLQERGTEKDERMADAIQLLRSRQSPEGCWKLEKKYPAKVHFDLEKVGTPSRWNTLRALRIMQWWEGPGEMHFYCHQDIALETG